MSWYKVIFFNDTATPENYPYCHTLSLHNALPISLLEARSSSVLAAPERGWWLIWQQRRRPKWRSEEHTSEIQSLMRISYAVFRLKKKKTISTHRSPTRS